MKKQSGFTLIEAMITVSVIAIIAAVALPSFLSQKRKGYRAEAIVALSKISVEMNRCYANRGGYTCCDDALILPKVLNAPPLTDRGLYSITIAPTNASGSVGCKLDQDFTITATAIADQANDANCPSFAIDHMGNLTAANNSCWAKQ